MNTTTQTLLGATKSPARWQIAQSERGGWSPVVLTPQRCDSQSYNRYSYVLNNPLAYTDPTGYRYEPSGWVRFRNEWMMPIVSTVANVSCVMFQQPIGCAVMAATTVINVGLAITQGSTSSAVFAVASAVASMYSPTASNVIGLMSMAYQCAEADNSGGSCWRAIRVSAFSYLTATAAAASTETSSVTAHSSLADTANTQQPILLADAGTGTVSDAQSPQYYQVEKIIVTGKNEKVADGFNRVISAMGTFAWWMVPGSGVVDCYHEGCDKLGWSLAAVGTLPVAGKGLGLAALGIAGSMKVVGQSFGRLGTAVGSSGLAITSFSRHGLDRAITRGVSPAAMLDAIRQPMAVLKQGTGNFLHVGEEAVVVLSSSGRVVTTYPARMYDATIQEIMNLNRGIK